MQHPLRRAPLVAAVCLFAALLAAPAASAASVSPIKVNGKPGLRQRDTPRSSSSRRGDLKNGTIAGITLSNVDVDGGTFDWSSSVAVDLVIVKGGPNANLYFYPLDTTSGHEPVDAAQRGQARMA